jgi:hypothetical protein
VLHDQYILMFLWVEACNTTIYIQNGSPHKALGNKTRNEYFIVKKPEVGRFLIFEFLNYSNVPLEKRTKLEPTNEKGIFVGYSETLKVYRIYIPSFKKTMVRRNVMF